MLNIYQAYISNFVPLARSMFDLAAGFFLQNLAAFFHNVIMKLHTFQEHKT